MTQINEYTQAELLNEPLRTDGGDGLAFFDSGSSSSDSFSPLLSSFMVFVVAAARFDRCGVVLLLALFLAGAFRFGDSLKHKQRH